MNICWRKMKSGSWTDYSQDSVQEPKNAWSLFLKEVVEKEGYETFQMSPSLYVKKSVKGDAEGATLVHVDDIQLAATPTEGQTEGQIGREVSTDNPRTLRTWWNGGVSALLEEKI
jgi:hypothetical protein